MQDLLQLILGSGVLSLAVVFCGYVLVGALAVLNLKLLFFGNDLLLPNDLKFIVLEIIEKGHLDHI